MRPSLTRARSLSISLSCGIVSKELFRSASTTKQWPDLTRRSTTRSASLAPLSRPEAEARRVEPRVQNWLQHEFDRGLGDAVLDRGNPQRPHSAIPFRDLHAP